MQPGAATGVIVGGSDRSGVEAFQPLSPVENGKPLDRTPGCGIKSVRARWAVSRVGRPLRMARSRSVSLSALRIVCLNCAWRCAVLSLSTWAVKSGYIRPPLRRRTGYQNPGMRPRPPSREPMPSAPLRPNSTATRPKGSSLPERVRVSKADKPRLPCSPRRDQSPISAGKQIGRPARPDVSTDSVARAIKAYKAVNSGFE